jgi:hypothetical protein
LRVKETRKEQVYDIATGVHEEKEVTTCQSNHVGMFMTVTIDKGANADSALFFNFLLIGMLFLMKALYN